MPCKARLRSIRCCARKPTQRRFPAWSRWRPTAKEVIYQGAFGKRDLSKDDAMTADSVFWIASMTKAITAAAAMQLVEQGKLSLDGPIGKLLPDLASPQVLEGFDANGEPKLRPAEASDHAAPPDDPHRRLLLRHVERRHGALSGEDRHARHHHLQERRAEDAADVRSRHALGIRHQHRFRRQGGGGRQRQAARRLPA